MKHIIYILVSVAIISAPKQIENTKISPQCFKYFNLVIGQSRLYDMWDSYDIFMGQIEQESLCNEKITAFDHGMGLAQFMPKTAEWIHSKYYDELSKISYTPNPYNPRWAIRAMILYDKYLLDRVSCKNDWHLALRAYNGGLGNINKEIAKANSCNYDEIAKHCGRSKFSCDVNIKYPYQVFKRSVKYNLYFNPDQ